MNEQTHYSSDQEERKLKIENIYDIDGYVIFLGFIQKPHANFEFRTIVISRNEGRRVNQEIPIEFVNEKLRLSDDLALNDHVHVTFKVEGRSIIGKNGSERWFASLKAINLSKL